jgi:hypothetical protein
MPLLNELSLTYNSYLWSHGQIGKKKSLMSWYNKIGELTGFINKVATDMTARFHFENYNPRESGRNKIMKSNRFAQEVVLSQTNEETVADALITGEGFGWIGRINDIQLKESIKSTRHYQALTSRMDNTNKELILNGMLIEHKERQQQKQYLNMGFKEREFTDDKYIDEDILSPRKYRCIPSTTMEIVFDRYDILEYKHVVADHEYVVFKPEEIIHYILMKRNGRVNGFTPVSVIIVQLELLRLMWQNMLSIHQNGGTPDYVFVLENQRVNSEEYRRVEQQLKDFKLAENKHGNFLMTGKVAIEMLQQMENMQFKDSGLYITGLIAMQWGIPKSSIPYIIGGTNTSDDTGGNAERGYWEFIHALQTKFADIQNTQFWIPYFGTRIIFENPYLTLNSQKESALQTKLSNIQVTESILNTSGKQIELKTKLKMLDLNDEDITDQVMMLDPMQGNAMNKQENRQNVNSSDSDNGFRNKKKIEQEQIMQRVGKPSGT